ncbi:MAG TPA: lysylphosphatidylglycerol synthase domain-containing protein [Saprospiraceae bacterium]|nr:lysylphosphatidylglycerol synthase domain-containing protein [Saprospiraceae bacterium]
MQKIVSRQSLNTLLKTLIFLALLLVLYRQLSVDWSKEARQAFLLSVNWFYLLLAILLMPLNWILEALKWRQFLSVPAPLLSFRQALRAVFMGVTLALITPYRMGDYIGRVLISGAASKKQLLLATLAGNLCQLVVLLMFGWLGTLYFAPRALTLRLEDYKLFLILGFLGTIILLLVIINIGSLLDFALRQRLLRRFQSSLTSLRQTLHSYDYRTFGVAFVLAAMRYGVYLTQYVLLLWFGNVAVSLPLAYAGVATVFLVQTSIPLPPALGLLARGEIALLVWSPFSEDKLAILAASFGLFIINLGLPSLIGLGAILKINLLQSLGYEKAKH